MKSLKLLKLKHQPVRYARLIAARAHVRDGLVRGRFIVRGNDGTYWVCHRDDFDRLYLGGYDVVR